MTSPTNSQRYRVIFVGRVQGVGFRYTVLRLVDQEKIAGYVRNLGNGDVELVAEGKSADLEQLVQQIEQAMRRNIHNTRIDQSAATGEFSGFEIRY